MRIGLALPQYGALAEPAGIGRFAAAAEELGYESLWTGDRVLTPIEPSDIYPGGGSPERPYPPEFTRFIDPLVTLTAAATATSRVRIGTGTLVATVYPPLLLGRTLTSLDVLSGGRLDVGLGIGWLREEYTATGVPWAGRGKRLEELLDVLTALWTGDPVAHDGELWRIPPSTVDLRPAQRPHPPILLGGFSRAALERVGRRADGWLPGMVPEPVMRGLWDVARAAAEQAGRDPDTLRRVVRINPKAGTSVAEVASTVAEARERGVDEAFVDPQFLSGGVDEAIDLAKDLRERIDRG